MCPNVSLYVLKPVAKYSFPREIQDFSGWRDMPTELRSKVWSCSTLDLGISHIEKQQAAVKLEMEQHTIDDQLAVLW